MPEFRLRLHPLGEPVGAPEKEAPANLPLPAEAAGVDDKGALRLFRAAAGLEPNDADYHYILGLGLLRAGRHAEAVAAFREALSLHRHDADYYCAYGSALWEVGYDEEAADAFREVLRIRAGDPWALNGLACAFTRMGREAEGIALFHEALRETSDDDISGNLGIALWRTGKTAEGLKSLRYALTLSPRSVHWLKQLAIAQAALGQHADAAATLRKVLVEQPEDAGVFVDLACALFDAGQHDAAEQALGEAVRVDSSVAAARPRVHEIRSALQLGKLRSDLRRRPKRRPLPAFVFTLVDAVAAISVRRPIATGFTALFIAVVVYLGYRLIPVHVTRYLLLDDIAAIAGAPIESDDDIRDRLRHAVRARGLERYLTGDDCDVDTRPKWRRIVCRYEVPVTLFPGTHHVLRLRIDVERPYLTQPETLHF
jgi:Flp pilus assembly protein TadD